MANEMVDKIKKSVNQGITNVSVKTASFSEKNKIKGYISSLQNEVKDLYTSLGEGAFQCMRQNLGDFSSLQPQYDLISQKLDEIQSMNQRLQQIEIEDNKILNSVNGNNSVQNGSEYVCTNCHAKYDQPYKFCKACGSPVVAKEAESKNSQSAYVCTNCHAEYSEPFKFCKACGSPVVAKESNINDEDLIPLIPVEVSSLVFECSGCHAEYNEPYKFCKVCGSPVVAKAVEAEVVTAEPIVEAAEEIVEETLIEPVVEETTEPVYVCTNCHAEYSEPYKFCKVCGSPVVAKVEEAADVVTEETEFEQPIARKGTQVYVCANCGAQFDQPYQFCKHCGNTLQPKSVENEEQSDSLLSSFEVYKCKNCGAEFDKPFQFCNKCGAVAEPEKVNLSYNDYVSSETLTSPVYVCSGCGTIYDHPCKFCKKCGSLVEEK